MIKLTEDECMAIHAYEGQSSQLLALMLMDQRETDIPGFVFHSATQRVETFNELLAAVRKERGR